MRGGIVGLSAAARHSPKGYDESDLANVRALRAQSPGQAVPIGRARNVKDDAQMLLERRLAHPGECGAVGARVPQPGQSRDFALKGTERQFPYSAHHVDLTHALQLESEQQLCGTARRTCWRMH